MTHMSHIETGNTKLSLAVFVNIAKALQVQTDELLYDNSPTRAIAMDGIVNVLNESTPSQIGILEEVVGATKIALDKHTKA
ncbi:MAG: helix-turn-helix transcriptional regulator [Bacillota bacterium]|nr:helix-turn-helix transcriptional regulator [Bacillota bacterium]